MIKIIVLTKRSYFNGSLSVKTNGRIPSVIVLDGERTFTGGKTGRKAC